MENTEKKITTSIKVIAILQIIFGCMGLMGTISTLALQAASGYLLSSMGSANDPQMKMQLDLVKGTEQVQADLPGGNVVPYGLIGLDLLLCVVMIVSGIGLLKMRSWGQSLAIGYAVFSLLVKVFVLIYELTLHIPALTEFLDTFGARYPKMQAQVMTTKITLYATPGVALIAGIYPIIVLYFMLKASNRAAFRGEAPVAPDARTAEEEPWGRV